MFFFNLLLVYLDFLLLGFILGSFDFLYLSTAEAKSQTWAVTYRLLIQNKIKDEIKSLRYKLYVCFKQLQRCLLFLIECLIQLIKNTFRTTSVYMHV